MKNLNKEIQKQNEALYDDIYEKIRYLFARVDLKNREQKTSKIVDYLTKQLGLTEDRYK